MRQITIVLLFLIPFLAGGQQQPQWTQYMVNKYGHNPAYGGLERSLSIIASYRDQNDGFPGNPRTVYLGADMPFYLWNGALGFTFYNQQTGVFSHSDLKVSYNYVYGTQAGFLSFGARAGLNFLNVNGSGIITPDGNYEGVINHNDPILDIVPFNGLGLSWEAGVYFMGRKLEAGLAINDLPSHAFSVGDADYTKSFSVSLFGQYKTKINDDIELIPSAMVRADAAVVQTDIGALGYYRDEVIGGINLRGYSPGSFDALGIIIGTGIGRNYRLIYSYDIGISSVRRYHQGSHEITLTYNLRKLIGMGLPPRIIYNPRDL